MSSVSAELKVSPPIEEVEIENFKSIRHLKLKCRRINVFIGEPNTGKSNILEAIVGLPSTFYYNPGRFGGNTKLFVRFEKYSNIFYDNDLEDVVKVRFVKFNGNFDFEISIYFRDGYVYCKVDPNLTSELYFPPSYAYDQNFDDISKRFKFYRFRQLEEFDRRESDFLLPPDGRNLPSIYLTHKSLKSTFREILKMFDLKLMIESDSNEIKVVKDLEDVLITYPYQNLSDTFQRLIFYLSAILTNKNSVIAMEEPEAHAFPYYTKYLAELIALNRNNNQYFITTHNPYFLLSLIEKSPKKDIAVFITYYKDYQTKVVEFSGDKLEKLLEYDVDVFFNIDRLLEESV